MFRKRELGGIAAEKEREGEGERGLEKRQRDMLHEKKKGNEKI